MSDERRPVVLVHGLGSTFEHNWRRHGWVDLLEAEGRRVVGFDMPGHGAAPLLGAGETGPGRLVDLCASIGPVDLVGFSAGSVLGLTATVERPDLFGRVALLGLADAQLQTTPESKAAGLSDPDAPIMRGIRLAAERAGNDVEAVLASALQTGPPPTFDSLARVRGPVLLVLGELDLVGRADRVLAALPQGRLVVLRETDHFSTTQRFEAKQAVLDFLAEADVAAPA
ncbi:alpha/beta fold hydrolase [Nocardioides sp. YIM 152588]|uniref:alpha/beta fold hydrolase n=1 Tax=Nocardioides sp. YIM 152588 TaxID=3158259 RepID=UPI0032E520AC